MSEERFTEIETKIAFQEDYIQSLNQVILSLQQKMDRLELEMRAMDEKLVVALEDQEPQNPAEECPPHY